jgi:PAT family beta-lactamase induction signal transducer AmpG
MSLAVLWLMAFSSATHDIAADGFYMLGCARRNRPLCRRAQHLLPPGANIAGQGGAGGAGRHLITRTGDAPGLGRGVRGARRHLRAAVHLALLRAAASRRGCDQAQVAGNPLREFFGTFASFFKRKTASAHPRLHPAAFRLGESQLLKLAVPFLLDPPSQGRAGLDNTQLGIAYGTVGVIALTLGGLLGGVLISRFGLKRCLWLMAFACHVPGLVFVYLSTVLPQNSAGLGHAGGGAVRLRLRLHRDT